MPTPTYPPLATITLSSNDSEIVFASIPSSYKDLVILAGGTTSSAQPMLMRFNTDAGANYSTVVMRGASADTGSFSYTSNHNFLTVGNMNSDRFDLQVQIFDYAATDKQKTSLSRTGYLSGGATEAGAHRWASTSAINTVRVLFGSGSFASGTTLSLYGIAG